MKKFIAVAAMLSVMFFGFGTSQALIGVPDDVPGTDILVPWIYVSMPGHGNENTLITITEVKGVATNLSVWINDIDSVPTANWEENLTPFDVMVDDGLSIINSLSPLARAALEVDTTGSGTPDHWAGYIYYFNNTILNNNLISNLYQVYLTAGMAASLNGVSMEFNTAFDPRQTNDPFWSIFGDEAYSANALWVGKNLLEFAVPPVADATFMRLMPRYFILDDLAQSLLMIWVETLYTGIPVPGLIHCDFYDEAENTASSNIPIIHELNIIDVKTIIPAVLQPPLFPADAWGGWIDIQTPDGFGNGWFTDANLNGIDDGAERQWLVWSWQRAYGPSAEAWEVIHQAHRETNP